MDSYPVTFTATVVSIEASACGLAAPESEYVLMRVTTDGAGSPFLDVRPVVWTQQPRAVESTPLPVGDEWCAEVDDEDALEFFAA